MARARVIHAHMSPQRRRQLVIVLALMVIGAFAEVATIGALVPFLGHLAYPGSADHLPLGLDRVGAALGRAGISSLAGATILFIAAAIAAAAIRLRLAWLTQRLIYGFGHELTVEVQRRILRQPYSFHIASNSSTLLSSLTKTEILVSSVMMPLLQAVTAGFIALVIVIGLIVIDPLTALPAAAVIVIVYLLVSMTARRRLKSNSELLSRAYDERLQTIQESLGAIRDVIIDDSHRPYLASVRRIDRRLTDTQAETAFIGVAPRFILEGAGMVLIAVVAMLFASRDGGIATALPILGALVLGAQRLLPLVQQVYHGWSSAAGHRAVVDEVVDFLQLPAPDPDERPTLAAPLPLADRIAIEGLSFIYPTRRAAAIADVSFEIARGSMLGLVGETGSGKSTLADLLMGLLDPTGGRITIDEVALSSANHRRWQNSIAHVPQAIFLIDASIERNIALSLGGEPIDHDRVVRSALEAQLHDVILALPQGYQTRVGERGVRLSGGQRQRLGLARAIYKQAPLLVLDEATSALDGPTEAAIIDALAGKGGGGPDDHHHCPSAFHHSALR